MLDFFLVLGQIPGTNLNLTFNQTIGLVVIVGVAGLAMLRGEEPQKPFLTVWDSLVSYENAHFKLPAEWTHHKASALPANTYVPWLDPHWRISR